MRPSAPGLGGKEGKGGRRCDREAEESAVRIDQTVGENLFSSGERGVTIHDHRLSLREKEMFRRYAVRGERSGDGGGERAGVRGLNENGRHVHKKGGGKGDAVGMDGRKKGKSWRSFCWWEGKRGGKKRSGWLTQTSGKGMRSRPWPLPVLPGKEGRRRVAGGKRREEFFESC